MHCPRRASMKPNVKPCQPFSAKIVGTSSALRTLDANGQRGVLAATVFVESGPVGYRYWFRLGKRSRLCRRATDKEYPGRRRTEVRAPGDAHPPEPLPLRSPEFMPPKTPCATQQPELRSPEFMPPKTPHGTQQLKSTFLLISAATACPGGGGMCRPSLALSFYPCRQPRHKDGYAAEAPFTSYAFQRRFQPLSRAPQLTLGPV